MDGSSLKSLYSFDEGLGKQIRDTIHNVGQTIDPIVKKVIPNFRAAHYLYIISWAIIGSILIYPVRDMRYIDALFLATGSATQAGLNTTDGNKLKLYQQIVVYFISMLTTPIFIHGSLLFVRLYWFERYFDNIKERSKLNFKMRREATLARTRTFNSYDPTLRNTYANQGLGLRKSKSRVPSIGRRASTSMFSHSNGQLGPTDPVDPLKRTTKLKRNSSASSLSHPVEKLANDLVEHITEPSSGDEAQHDVNTSALPVEHEGIKFADLPHPARRQQVKQSPSPFGTFGSPHTNISRRKNEVEPSDMFRSIAIMQENKKQAQGSTGKSSGEGDDDDVLIIRPPNEIENDSSGAIYTTKKSKDSRSPSRLKRHWNSRKWSSKFKQNFSNNPRHSRSKSQISDVDLGADDDASIDSEFDETAFKKLKEKVDKSGKSNENAIADDDDDDDDNNSLSNHKVAPNEDEGDINGDEEELDSNSSIISDDQIVVSSNDEDGETENEGHIATDDEDDDYFNYKEKHKSEIESQSNHSPHLNIVLPENGRQGSVSEGPLHLRSPTFDKFLSPARHFGKKTKRTISKTTSRGLKKLSSGFVRSNSFALTEASRVNTGPSINSLDSEYDEYDNDDDDGGDDHSYYTDIENNSLQKMTTNYLSWNPTVGRNSTFINLNDEQKEELGGVEYRAVKLLIKIIVVYYVGFHIVGVVAWVPYILKIKKYKEKVNDQGLNAVWWAIFTSQSSFNDLGLTLTADSMVSFYNSAYILIWSAFFIVIGNTGFPIFLRFLIWILFKISKPLSLFNESLAFLLDHPRRCFTLLFPSVPTWWLFIILVVLNGIDLILFIVLDLNSSYLNEIPVGYRILDGLYQAFSTRTAGFTVVDLSQLHPAVQVSYMLMMYISVLPLAISIRRTNVYEEQSLGVYLKDQNPDNDIDENTSSHFIGTHLRNQLSFDLWFIFLGLFIICIAEGGKLDNMDPRFSVFAVLFEIISAYGTVGLSLGYPNVNTSFSGQFSTLSKLVIIAMMIRGRHRGLPYSLDRAIMLPNKMMAKRDHVQQEHAIRRNATTDSVNGLFNSSFDTPSDEGVSSGSFHGAQRRQSDKGLLRRVITSGGDIFEHPGRVLLNRRKTSAVPDSSSYMSRY